MKIAASDAQVRAALNDILRWDEIARSGQLAKFLSYIVEAKIRGEGEAIKAYSIAVDVFGRAATFDPQADPIVRVQARRLRTLLDQYYRQVDDPGPVRIDLPVGRYVPEFSVLVPDDSPETSELLALDDGTPTAARLLGPSPSASRFGSIHLTRAGWVLCGAVLAMALATFAVGQWNALHTQALPPAVASTAPRVNVLEFQNLTGDNGRQSIVGGLALELVTDLQLFEDIDVRYGQSAAEAGSNPAQAGVSDPSSFVLSGIARVTDGRVQYGVILKRSGSDAVVWSHAISYGLAETDAPGWIDTVSRSIALMLGSHRGPLDADARTWLATQPDIARVADPYLCRLLFHIYSDGGLAVDAERAQTCVDTLLTQAAPTGEALAIQASLIVDAALRSGPKGPGDASMRNAGALIDQALTLDATSSFVWAQKAHLHAAVGQMAAAQADYNSALQLNPANDDAIAAYATMLSLTPEWSLGAQAALTAISATPEPPAWYYIAPALNSLRARQFATAITYGETVAGVDQELGAIISVVAGTAVGNISVVNRYLPQILEQHQFRAHGIMVQLSQRITDRVLLNLIRTNLLQARVPSAALDAPF